MILSDKHLRACVNIDNTDTKTIIQDANIDERDTNKNYKS